MPGQTIALFRFQMLGIVNRRLLVLLALTMLGAVLGGLFVRELALINGAAIATALVADLLRYGLGLLLLLTVVVSVNEDYETRQFERLLTMPLARWQYIAAQCLVVLVLALLLAAPVFPLLAWTAGMAPAVHWSIALWLELVLLGLLGLLAALSLEKIPQAMFFALTVYLLARMSGLIELMLAESIKLTDGGIASSLLDFVFNLILYVLPGSVAFADSDLFILGDATPGGLLAQAASVAVYGAFLLAVSLVDFYRKEFNL